MVAHLLEAEDRAEHLAAVRLVVVLALDVAEQVVDDRLVERGLLAGQVARLGELDLVGQLGCDRAIGLDAAEEERRGEPPEPVGRVLVVPAFDRDREPALEGLRRAQEAGVREVHDRPQLREPVLDRRPREGEPGRRPQRPRRAALRAARVLDLLCLVEDDASPGHAAQRLAVAGDQRVGREHELGLPHGGREARARPAGRRRGGRGRRGRARTGPPRAASSPRATSGRRRSVGPIRSGGGTFACSATSSASSWTVLPRPMSSARMPPKPEPVEVRQPSDALLLVRAQRGSEARGRRHGGRRGGRGRVEDPADPALGDHARDLETAGRRPEARRRPEDVRDRQAGPRAATSRCPRRPAARPRSRPARPRPTRRAP